MGGFSNGGNATELQGEPISTTTPTTSQVLTFNGTSWAPAAGGGGGITALTGDVTASGTGSVAATLVGTTNVESIISANGTVAAAYANANTAITNASTAQTTANTALANAATAQTTANNALPLAGGTMTGAIAMSGNAITNIADVAVSGITGATTATRYVGGTVNGAPTTGTFNTGDFVIDQTATIWIYTGATSGWSSTISNHVKNRTSSATVQRNEITQFTGSTGQTFTSPSNPIDGSSWTFLNNTANTVTLSFTPSMYPLGSGSSVSTFTVAAYGVFSFVNYNGSNWYMTSSNSLGNVVGTLPIANGGTGLSTVGSNGQVLTVVSGAPAWAAASGGAVNVNSATGYVPPSYWISGAYAQTLDPNSQSYIATQGGNTPAYTVAKGYLNFAAIYLVSGQTVTNLSFYVETAGTAATCYLGLYNATTQLGATASFTANATGFLTKALTTPYSVTTSGLYYIAFLCVNTSTTAPLIFGGVPNNIQIVFTGFGPTPTSNTLNNLASYIAGTATTLPSTISGTPTASGATPWFSVS